MEERRVSRPVNPCLFRPKNNLTTKIMSNKNQHRPVFMSVVQYQDRLANGSMSIFEIIQKARDLGVDGIELRRDRWKKYEEELPEAKALIKKLGLMVTFATF